MSETPPKHHFLARLWRLLACPGGTRVAQENPSFTYVVVVGAATLYVATVFLGSARLQTLYADYWSNPGGWQSGVDARELGPWSAPLDDVFIHFDFARSAARGRPFEWARGNGYSSGGTSLLYPLILAVGYRFGRTGLDLMEWAGIVASVSVFVLLLSARKLFRGLPALTEYLAPAALLGIGALSWSLFSGMEIALFLALWGGAFTVWDRIDTGRADDARTLLGRAALLGLAGAALVATRPEGVATTAVLASSAAWLLRARSKKLVLGVFALAVIPCGAFVVCQALANLALTGEMAAAGAIAKLEFYHPYLTAGEKFDRWLFYLGYQVLRVTQQHFETMPVIGWFVWVFAALALVFRETRLRAIVLWASFVSWAMVVATNGQVRWQNERYTMPAVAWLLLAAALGVAAVVARAWDAPKSKPRVGLAVLSVAVVVFFAWQAVPAFRFQSWYFGRAARNIYDQQVGVGKLLRDRFRPPPRRVLVGDAGAIQYVTDAPTLDLIGLGGYRGMPFVRATRAHVGAAIELIERIDVADRPDVLAIYPSWWDELPLWFGSRLTEVPARGNVICGAPSKVLYRASWASLDGSAEPFVLVPGERVVAELDWADVISEKAAGYRRIPRAEGRVALKLLAHSQHPERDVFDAGRHSPSGTRERFRLSGIDIGRPLRLIVRAAPVADVRIPVGLGDQAIATLELPRTDGWAEASVTLGTATESTIDVELGPSEERVLYHLWAVQGP